jgi:hypothetical protein
MHTHLIILSPIPPPPLRLPFCQSVVSHLERGTDVGAPDSQKIIKKKTWMDSSLPLFLFRSGFVSILSRPPPPHTLCLMITTFSGRNVCLGQNALRPGV